MNAYTVRHVALATLLAGSMVLAGCGDDEGEESATDFCTAVASFESASAANPATTPADQLEAQFTELRSALDDLSASAPDEVADAVEVVTSTFEGFIDAFEAQDYDYAAFTADPDGQEAMAALSSDEMGAATGDVLAYASEQCGGDGTGIANPASVFCEEQGGTVEIVDEADGQVGYCNLPDGTRIEEWEYFRQETGSTQP